MKLIFIMKSGSQLSWEVPEANRATFNFAMQSRGIRCDGFFQTDDMHIVYSEVAVMLLAKEDAPHPAAGVKYDA